MNTPRPGWQQPARPLVRKTPTCMHLGLLGASFTIGLHDTGHVWVCQCGAEFVVVSNGGQDKRFEKRSAR